MRITWFAWLAQHVDEYGYDDGPLRASIGTGAVLVTAALLWGALHRNRPAAMAAAYSPAFWGSSGWPSTEARAHDGRGLLRLRVERAPLYTPT